MLTAVIGPQQTHVIRAYLTMSTPAPAGKRRRVPPRAEHQAPLLRTPELLQSLKAEGFVVSRRMLDYAVAHGFVPAPRKFGNWRRWSPQQADAFRAYLRSRSHVQPAHLYEKEGGK